MHLFAVKPDASFKTNADYHILCGSFLHQTYIHIALSL